MRRNNERKEGRDVRVSKPEKGRDERKGEYYKEKVERREGTGKGK